MMEIIAKLRRRIYLYCTRKVQTYASNDEVLCRLGKDSVLYPTATIRNLHGDSSQIVIGSDTHIRGDLATFWHGGSIVIGDYCYVGEGTRIWSAASVKIHDRVLISHNVNIFDNTTHPIDDYEARHRQFVGIIKGNLGEYDLKAKPVVIECDVLIAAQSIILPGITVGKAAVVAAGSVVTKDVEPFTVVAGNPARIIRKIKQVEGET